MDLESGTRVAKYPTEQANGTSLVGLFWLENRLTCNIVRLKRCGRCQAYGHLIADCFAPYRCGKCALEHAISDCQFEFTNCALCHGDHYAGTRLCRVKAEEE